MKTIWISAAAGAILGLGLAAAASAAAPDQSQSTPSKWNYEIKNGKRVPKGERVVKADGSWREEIRQGRCLTVKEKSAAGVYKETRECEPK